MNKKKHALILTILIILAILITGKIWYDDIKKTNHFLAPFNDGLTGASTTVAITSTTSIASYQLCDYNYSTSSLSATWTSVVGAWESVSQNSSFGDEIEFTSYECDGGYAFISYYYNPVTGVTQPSILGTWNFLDNGLEIIDEFNTSSPPYTFPRFTAGTTTLLLYNTYGSVEKYFRTSSPFPII